MLRVALYSHDTFGLGHLRRSLKLAAHIRAYFGAVDGLLLTGSAWHSLFACPPGFRIAPLSPVSKEAAGSYRSREPGVEFAEVLRRRRERISRALATFKPHLFVVDNVPCGLHGEVLPAVRRLQRRGTRIVLALRDVLDDLDLIRQEWSELGAGKAVAEHFDEIWVFGDAQDAATLIRRGPLGGVASKVHSCGRIGQLPDSVSPAPARPSTGRPLVLVTGGGGRDASPLISTYLDAVSAFRPPVTSHVVLGPDFPAAERPARPPAELRTTLADFVPDLPERIAQSNVVVSMAGYNTVCEILASGRPAVLVPRVTPRQEQLLRARRWDREGRARLLDPRDLTPEILWHAVHEQLSTPALPPVETNGGVVAAARAAALLGVPTGGVA